MLKIKYLLPLILILLLTFTLTGFCWVAGYDQRVKLTIDETKIDTANLTNFPVTAFFTDAQAEEIFAEFDADEDFDRGQFALENDTLLKAEKELFDFSESLGLYHIKIPLVYFDADTDYYFYYDNDAGHNTDYIGIAGSATAAEVWVDFKAVYHMNDNTEDIDVDVALELPEHSNTGDPAIALSVFTAVNCYGLTKVNGTLKIDMKCSDPDLIEGELQQLEISSSATNDTNEWFTDTSALDITTDYQTFEIPLSTWTTAGGEVNVTSIKRVRWYAFSSGVNVTIYWKNAYIVYPSPLCVLDSTSNANHGYKKGFYEPVEAAGQVGIAQDFDGSDDYIHTADQGITGYPFTLSALIKPEAMTLNGGILYIVDENDATIYYGIRMDSSGKIQMDARDDVGISQTQSVATLENATWYHVALVFASATSRILYINGASNQTSADSVTFSGKVDRGLIGKLRFDDSICFEGIIDESRVDSVVRTAAWNKATYNSLWDTLLTYGSEETEAVSGANIMFIFSDF